jgi:N-acetylglucosamine malate deacetylase 1
VTRTTNLDRFFEGSRVLVVSPHADDETFGCAGTLARAVACGADVGVMLVSVANLKQYSHSFSEVTGKLRVEEFRNAMKCLGVQHTDILYEDEYAHMRLDKLARRDLVQKIERESTLAVDVFKPDILLFPAISYNQDHEALFKAVYSVCRPHLPTDKPFVRAVFTYDQPQLAWNYAPFHPNVYVDITKTLSLKIAAYRCHASQIRPEPHHASIENVERLARLRGSEVSVVAAEAFECHRLLL